MEKKVVPKSITIDLSKLNEEDREILYAQLVRTQRLANDIPKIRAAESGAANKIVNSFESNGASVYAESETISDVVNKEDVRLLPVGPHSTDLLYVNKETLQHFRVEIKSITQAEPGAIDREITNAEVQHKDRLNEEKEQKYSTWHYTIVDIGNKNNPWPFSSMKELLEAKERDNKNPTHLKDHILLLAEKRIDKLQSGGIQPSKTISREVSTPIKGMVTSSEIEQRERAKLPLTPPHVSSQSKQAVPQPSEANKTQADNRPRREARSKTVAIRSESVTPTTPNTQVFKDTLKQREDIKEKNRDLSPDDQAKRKLLVTEKIKIKSPLFDSPIVLIRTEKRFKAHFKGEKSLEHPEKKAWIPEAFKEKISENSEKTGNNDLHDAIQRGDVSSVKKYCNKKGLFIANGSGDFPIHLAVKSGNEEIVRLVLAKTNYIDLANSTGDTALHLACRGNKPNIAKILVDSKANLYQENYKKETPKSLIEASKDPDMKVQLDSSATKTL